MRNVASCNALDNKFERIFNQQQRKGIKLKSHKSGIHKPLKIIISCGMSLWEKGHILCADSSRRVCRKRFFYGCPEIINFFTISSPPTTAEKKLVPFRCRLETRWWWLWVSFEKVFYDIL
jgi:hypothetical protein